jgi:hypothetical protein
MIEAFHQRLEHWAFREAPPHILALLRLGTGAFLFFYWGLKGPHVAGLFSDQGLWLPLTDGSSPVWLQLLASAPPADVAWLLYGLFMVCLLLVTIGLWMRPAAVLAVVLYAYYWLISLHLFPTSYDRLFPFLLAVLAFSGADRTFSVRSFLTLGSPLAWETCSVLPQRLIALQVAATYLGVGWQKMVLPAWQSGDILVQSMMGMWGTPIARWLMRLNLPATFYDQTVRGVMALEFWLPIGLWIPRVQWGFFVAGALFHLLVAILLGIWWFLILIPAYIAFLPPETVFRVLQRFIPIIPDTPGPFVRARLRHLGLGRHRGDLAPR